MPSAIRTVAALAAAAISTIALGAPLPPGGTLDPIPASLSPPGGTIIFSNSFPFSITHDVPPFNNCPGTLYQSVVRRADGTLIFRYHIELNTTCLEVDRFTISSFSGFSTDLVIPSLGLITDAIPSDATRSAPTGTTITVNFDNGIPVGGKSRTLYVSTDAVDFDLSGVATAQINSGEFSSGAIVGLARPVPDATPPTVAIIDPGPLGCSCNPVTITGTANDAGGLDSYILEYAADPNGPWHLIIERTTPVINGSLALWDTTALPQGYYFVRLTAHDDAGFSNSVTTIVFVDKQFDDLDVRLPVSGDVYARGVCFDGTAWDHCFSRYFVEYAPLPAAGPYNPVDPSTPFYTLPVINDPLASWTTDSGPAAVPDGEYRVRIRAMDQCNPAVIEMRDIIVDNTAPTAELRSPQACTSVQGVVQVVGTAFDQNLAGWTLQYAGAGDHQWVTIASGNTNVVNGLLANWDTSDLRPCPYALRLVVTDLANINCSGFRQQSEFVTVVNVGCEADFNGDDAVDVFDLLAYLDLWFGGC